MNFEAIEYLNCAQRSFLDECSKLYLVKGTFVALFEQELFNMKPFFENQKKEFKKMKNSWKIYHVSSQLLTPGQIESYCSFLLRDENKRLLTLNIEFQLCKKILLGFKFLILKLKSVVNNVNDKKKVEALFQLSFKEKMSKFKAYVENFNTTTLPIIDDLKTEIFNEAQTQFVLTQLLSETIYNKTQLETNEYYSELLSNINNYMCVYTIKNIDLAIDPIYKPVYQKLTELFEKCTNNEILEIFYLANLENEVIKNMKNLEINQENRKKLAEDLIKSIPKQIYSIDWDNRVNAAFTSSKGLVFVSKGFIVEENANEKEILISQAKIFLSVLHEMLHKMRLLTNFNDYLNLENEGTLGIYNFEHEIGTFFEKKIFLIDIADIIFNIPIEHSESILNLSNYEPGNIKKIQSIFQKIKDEAESQVKIGKSYGKRMDVKQIQWRCRPDSYYNCYLATKFSD